MLNPFDIPVPHRVNTISVLLTSSIKTLIKEI